MILTSKLEVKITFSENLVNAINLELGKSASKAKQCGQSWHCQPFSTKFQDVILPHTTFGNLSIFAIEVVLHSLKFETD